MSDRAEATVVLELEEGYRFRADLGLPGVAPLVLDEPPPLGEGAGPDAARVLAAAVGGCLSASALFCLRKAKVDVRRMRTEVSISFGRNEVGRLRIGGIRVRIAPEVDRGDAGRIRRCLAIFEEYCTVTQSVRAGIGVEVDVEPVVVEGDVA
ncbi:MAG TPA: OsmC family protein [Actinomycetota bacterium]|nr:OsmC family protein [Actinomycetota bacterium]